MSIKMIRCNECGNLCDESSIYIDKIKNKLICVYCMTKEKKRRLNNCFNEEKKN